MGLLESVIGGVVGQVLGGGGGSRSGSSGMSPLVKALLMLLLAKGMSGGFGDIFGRGGGQRSVPQPEPGGRAGGGLRPEPRDDGDMGGFDQYGGGQDRAPGRADSGEFGDLSGMLDGPGGAAPDSGGAGSYARNAGQEEPGASDLGGLDGLVERFQQSGLGDVIGSWIGHGGNRPVQPNQLAAALGADTLDALERQTGMDRDTLATQLAQILPEVVDKLTPHGRAPDESERRGW
ncbi:YidB family protein [Methylobacterium sp. sgz302541]|uniref:YidB family protein n=1 Tax=unclassified Methylobacterium TaxID=2615210 RepID=UPI003D3395E6